jgi:acyl carrier protein
MTRTTTPATFTAAMVGWLNERYAPPGLTIDADTALFADRIIDSIRILDLIAWTERATGRVIPDDRIRMDHFRTVAVIARTFCAKDHHAAA